MGRHSGERATQAARSPRRRIVRLCLGILVTLAAWVVLVLVAIHFGRDARSGNAHSWTMLALATAGAIVCLFVTMTLAARVVASIRARSEAPAPARVRGRRVAR